MDTDELQENVSQSRYLIKCPKVLQWFHNDELTKAPKGERQAGRFELFLDLLYVTLVANSAEDFAANPTGKGLVQYILIFAPAWHVWSDLREIMHSYYTDDLVQRLIILWVMALLVLYDNKTTEVASEISAMRTTVGAFMAARFTAALVFLTCSFASYQHLAQARLMAGFILLGLCILVPLYFETVSIRAESRCLPSRSYTKKQLGS